MIKFLFASLAVIAALAVVMLISRSPKSSGNPATTAEGSRNTLRTPVLVELFTSEGCSSCPPADELLMQLEQSQPVASAEIIALSEHVDYWNHLGWKDPYSSAEFSGRQNDYGTIFKTDDIYTPQMVVDGRTQFVGSNSAKASEAIEESARGPKAAVSITVPSEDNSTASLTLAIHIDGLQEVLKGEPADVLLAITESDLRSSVSSGENAGRRLTHTAVVRKLSRIGTIDSSKGGAFSVQSVVRIEKAWKQENAKAVIFVQEHTSRRVLGAGTLSLGK